MYVYTYICTLAYLKLRAHIRSGLAASRDIFRTGPLTRKYFMNSENFRARATTARRNCDGRT